MLLAGLDLGTTGCKTVIFDETGKPLGTGFREYGMVCREPGMAEQDALRVWQQAKAAFREALEKSRIREVHAVSLSVQGDAIIPLGADKQPLYPAILGMDYRSEPQAKMCAERFGGWELFQKTGMRPHPMNSAVKALWLRENRPEVFARTKHIVTYGDFAAVQLTGELAIDYTMASRTMAFDLKQRRWHDEILGGLSLDTAQWSRPIASGKVIGLMLPEIAAELGLCNRPMVVAGGHDQPCAALGAGVVREKLGVISTGTAEVLSTAFKKPVLTREMYDGYYPCYLHAREGMYFTFALNHIGGILLRWYRDEFAREEVGQAEAGGGNAYALIDAAMPRGPSPLMVLPHWNGSGTPYCDLKAKGAIVGLTMASTRHDVAKAILEGLAFELQINLTRMLESGIDVRELAAVGGGAKSAAWLQIKADVLNRPIRTLACSEAACLGAALLAGVAAGAYSSLEEGVGAAVHYDREYTPRPQAAARYAERFSTYAKLYQALKPVNLEL